MKKKSVAKPFLKWAGGKAQLLSQFEKYYPEELKLGKIKKYIEPFLGGGAVFFDIAQKYSIDSAYLYDLNEELIIAYKVIQLNPDKLLEFLFKYSKQYLSLQADHRKKYFYDVRQNYNLQRFQIDYDSYSENWIPRTAQMIFLNRTCYNGLFRLNRKGEFNVPFGAYKNPKILDEENILAVSQWLQIAEIRVANFDVCEKCVDENSFVYFDPPYRPISRTSSFTSYSKYEFGDAEQFNLAKFFALLDKKYQAKLMLSNSDPTYLNPDDHFFNELYLDYHIQKVCANRMINRNAEKRGHISELLIMNYEYEFPTDS